MEEGTTQVTEGTTQTLLRGKSRLTWEGRCDPSTGEKKGRHGLPKRKARPSCQKERGRHVFVLVQSRHDHAFPGQA